MQPDGAENTDEMHVYGIDRYVSICRSASVIAVPSLPECSQAEQGVGKEGERRADADREHRHCDQQLDQALPGLGIRAELSEAARHEQPVMGHCLHVRGATANDGVPVVVVTPKAPNGGVFVTWNWPFPITEA